MRTENGTGIKACGWGCVTLVAIVSVVLGCAWYAMYVRG
jgi:hypothetical protein